MSNSWNGFTENKGQWDGGVFFKISNTLAHLLFKKNSVNYYLLNQEEIANLNGHLIQNDNAKTIVNGHYISVVFENSNPAVLPVKEGANLNSYTNYYLGNDKAKWQSNVLSYNQILYPQIYPHIDLKINCNLNNSIKYDWVLKPFADLKNIQIKINGADSIYINYDELYISTSQGILKEQKPFAYQYINGIRKVVKVKYRLKNNTISFEAEAYNKEAELIIDPDLIFSTYSGSTEDNFGFTATYDSKGDLYAGGITTSAFGGKYPVTPGAFQLTYKGGKVEEPVHLPCDITISKYSSDGTQLIYATYLGGTENEYPHSLVVDTADNLVIMGSSKSLDFPMSNISFDKSQNGDIDIIVSKISKDGTTLLGSTFVGGANNDGLNFSLKTFYADDFRGDVIIDKQNNIIVGSCSTSPNFPVSAGSFGSAIPRNIQKGVVFKLTPNCETMVFSSALSGISQDVIYSVDLNELNDIFIAGTTTGNMLIANATNTYFGGNSDGFMAKIKQDGSVILKAKYFGTPSSDQVFSLEIDADENIFIVGNSLFGIPASANVYSVPNAKQFISKINKNFDSVLFTSTFGRGLAGVDLSINAFLLDKCGRLYISGWGGNGLGGSTFGLPTTADAFQKNTDGKDFYLMVLSENAERLLYASYFGGGLTADHVDGGTSRFDKKGVIYQSVCASCPNANGQPTFNDFPISANAVFKNNVSPRCSNAAFKMAFNFKQSYINFDIDSCLGLINLSAPLDNFLSYLWILPNGKTSNLKNPVVTISEINFKEIALIINNGTPCADTAKIIINYIDTLNKINIANVFTPNNDGINDYFGFEGLVNCSEVKITIYNRWGQEMYSSNKLGFKWDGTLTNGEPANSGVYYYIGSYAKNNFPQQNLHGTITLIR